MKLATIATAAGFAGLATLAALALSAVDRVMAESRDNSIRAAAEFIRFAEPVTIGELHHAPEAVQNYAWTIAGQRWEDARAKRAAADLAAALQINQEHADAMRERADEDDTAAADARLFEFARGIGSHVDEEDLLIGSPAAVAAASARLD